MKRNPFLKVEKLINRKVYSNAAILKLTDKKKVYDEQSGEIIEIPRHGQYAVYISNPHEISEAVVDGKYYLKGDLLISIAYLEVAEATSAFGREDDAVTGGIRSEYDSLLFNNREYRIVKASPKNFYAGTPSKIKIQLRAV